MLIADLVIIGVGGARLNLPTYNATNVSIQNTKHGYGKLQFTLRLSYGQTVTLYNNPQPLNVKLKLGGNLFDGRLEDVELLPNGVRFTVLGYYRAFNDAGNTYTAVWSVSGVKDWRTITEGDVAFRTPKKYAIDFQDRLYIGLVKNAVYTNGGDVAELAYVLPYNSITGIIGLSIDITYNLPVNWTVQVYSWATRYSTGTATAVITSAGGGAGTFTYNITCVSGTMITLDLLNNSGANYTMLGETGSFFVKATNIRLVGSTTNRVATTLTVARAAGVNVTATVGSIANMYVGQLLQIDTGNFNSETVTVLSFGSPTTFNATFVNAHAIGQPVNAHNIYPNEIITNLLAVANASNPTQISTSTALISTPTFDLLNEIYEDTSYYDIIDYLCDLGDGTQSYEAGVYDDKMLFFRPEYSTARYWYIILDDPQIAMTLDTLANSNYVVYKDASGKPLRTATNSNAASIARYGVTRWKSTKVDTTNLTLANLQRDRVNNQYNVVTPQATIRVKAIYTSGLARARLTDVRPNDYIVIKNIPSSAVGTILDRVRTLRVVETNLDWDSGLLSITPEVLYQSIAVQLAKTKTNLQDLKTSNKRQT
jgi:hypothetical protein